MEFRAKYNYPSDAETAARIFESGIFHCSHEEISAAIRQMINSGSRYKNLENNLAPGATLALGQNLSDSLLVFSLPDAVATVLTFAV